MKSRILWMGIGVLCCWGSLTLVWSLAPTTTLTSLRANLDQTLQLIEDRRFKQAELMSYAGLEMAASDGSVSDDLKAELLLAYVRARVNQQMRVSSEKDQKMSVPKREKSIHTLLEEGLGSNANNTIKARYYLVLAKYDFHDRRYDKAKEAIRNARELNGVEAHVGEEVEQYWVEMHERLAKHNKFERLYQGLTEAERREMYRFCARDWCQGDDMRLLMAALVLCLAHFENDPQAQPMSLATLLENEGRSLPKTFLGKIDWRNIDDKFKNTADMIREMDPLNCKHIYVLCLQAELYQAHKLTGKANDTIKLVKAKAMAVPAVKREAYLNDDQWRAAQEKQGRQAAEIKRRLEELQQVASVRSSHLAKSFGSDLLQPLLDSGQPHSFLAKVADNQVGNTKVIGWNDFEPSERLRSFFELMKPVLVKPVEGIQSWKMHVCLRGKTASEQSETQAALINYWDNDTPTIVYDKGFTGLPESLQTLMIMNELLQLDFKKSGNDYLFTRAANADLQVELASLLSLVLVLSENDYAQWIDLLSTHMDLTYQLKGTDVMTLVKMLKNLRNKQQELWQWHQTQSLWENEDLFAGMRHVFGPQTVTEGQLTVLKSA